MDETFTLLPLHLDPTSKALTSPTLTSPDLTSSLTALNTLHRSLLSLPSESHQTPPPPMPTNPKRSAQIQKMRDQGNASLRKSTPTNQQPAQEAIKLYTYALDMALSRPSWEPSGLIKEETSVLYSNRAQAYMSAQMWPEGQADAETSVGLKRQGNGKAWWRRGVCLKEMGRWEEGLKVVREGIEVEGEGEDGELARLAKEMEAEVRRREERGR